MRSTQAIICGCSIEDRDLGRLRETGERQQIRSGEIGYDQTDASPRQIAKGSGNIAILRHRALDEFEGLAGKTPGRVVIGDAEPCALYPFVLGRLIEVGKRQSPFGGLRQPTDLDRLTVGAEIG